MEERKANEMGFTDKGRHGRGERRETSKDFNVTAFHTDNSASAVHVRQHTHAHTRTPMHTSTCTALMAEGQGRVELPALASHSLNGGGC